MIYWFFIQFISYRAHPRLRRVPLRDQITFLRGASQPEELVARAKHLGYTALAIADECSMAGIVRAYVAAKERELKLLIGAKFQVDWVIATSPQTTPFTPSVLACNPGGCGNLCQFITEPANRGPGRSFGPLSDGISQPRRPCIAHATK